MEEELADDTTIVANSAFSKIKYRDETQPYMFSFKTPSRMTTTVHVTMIDHLNGTLLPVNADGCLCWWCRCPISPNSPIGCPVKYTPEREAQSMKQREFFTTVGMFDSIPCIQAYIESNCHNPLYKDSACLLNMFYRKLTQETCKKIYPAPDWRLLKHNGGKMTVDEYRKTFQKKHFITTDNVIHAPLMSTISFFVEKRQAT